MQKNILITLKAAINKAGLDGFVIPSTDEFQNEYVPAHLNRLKHVTGFTGSNGVAIICQDTCAFFTDGRYLLQAAKQLGADYKVLDMGERASCDWFDLGLRGGKLGYDPMLHSKDNLAYYERLGAKYGFTMVACDNLVDTIWKRDSGPMTPAFELDIQYAGLSYLEKRTQVLSKLDAKASGLLVTGSDSVCWLLNIRGADIDYTPFLLSFAILKRDGTLDLFTDPRKITFTLPQVTVRPLDEIFQHLSEGLQIDFTKTPVKLLTSDAINAPNPIELLKACKNATEIEGFRKAHIIDGVALAKFMYWLSNHSTTEMEGAQRLLEFRQESELFVYPSFGTISAYGANASIIHYQPSTDTDIQVEKDNFYLLDSGAQYYCGTTDVTRTMHLGIPTAKQQRLFTLVLKGHINLARAKFPKGTTGAQLDALARAPLWEEGLDFAHGTGHGVGHFLAVHEGPQRISKSLANPVALAPGMIVSNEPGFYQDGVLGIRIENLLLVVESKEKGYLEFETLTLAPLQKNLIDTKLLDSEQTHWLETYHNTVLAKLLPHVPKEVAEWLKS